MKTPPSELKDSELESSIIEAVQNVQPSLNLYLDELRHRQTTAALYNIGAQLSATANLLGDLAKTLGEINVTLGQMNTRKKFDSLH